FKTPFIRGISSYIKKAAKNKFSLFTPIKSTEKKAYYLLSSAQKRLYFLQQMEEDGIGYNIPQMVILEGNIEIHKLENTFKELIKRHESLRTSFEIVENEPVQRIHDDVQFEVEYYEATEDTEEKNYKLQITNYKQIPNSKSQITNKKETRGHHSLFIIHRSFIRPFDLSHAPLLRVGLIETGEGNHILIDIHHIITDGTSQYILTKEFMELYAGNDPGPLRLQYKDFSGWQNSHRQQQLIKKQEEYWLNIFSGQLPVLDLPTDNERPKVQSFAGASVKFFLDEKETRHIKNIVNENDATLFMFLFAVFNILLAKLSGQEDIIVGIPIASRRHKDLEKIIGMFVNTLAPRNYPVGEKTFNAFLEEIKKRTLEVFENQEYPFEVLVDKVSVGRDVSRNPLFDVMFILQNVEIAGLEIPGIKILPDKHETNISKFDLSLRGREAGDGLFFSFEYSTKLFKKETIERFIAYFKKIVSSILKKRDIKISEIEIIDETEKNQLLFDFNKTGCSYPADKLIYQMFAEQVERVPDHAAIVGTAQGAGREAEGVGTRFIESDPGKQNAHLTYKQLNKKSNQLARLLRVKGIIPDTIAGIMIEPAVEMMIAILAILKAGGSYLPIDPHQPRERISYMLNDSQAALLLTSGQLSETLNITFFNYPYLLIDDLTLYHGDETNLKPISRTHHVLYTIYTSGTTGKSKGTLVENKNLVNYIHWFKKKINLTVNDRTVLTSSFGFDLGYSLIYSSILSGCQLHIIPRQTYYSPEDLIRYICCHRITYIKVTPSLFTTIVESSGFSLESCQTLRLVVLGGEEIKLPDLDKAHALRPHLEIMNHYGPTEATIGCVAQMIDFDRFEQYKKRPTIGYPINNMKVFVLDKGLKLVPVGVPGELCVSGAGTARGYLNRPDLTAEKFNHKRKKVPGKRIYRTGDLARWLETGNIEFLGRMDTQVKIRGYRIETSEIENHLLEHNAIKEAVVILRQRASADKYLCAYIVPHKGGDLAGNETTAKKIREHLSKTLPDYMIPLYFILMDEIPLTPNGKIARDALPAPGANASQSGYTPPRDQVEVELAALWSEVLNIEKPGIDDNFFELGGHSLKATVLMSKIHKTFNIKIPLAELFKTPFIRGISSYIKKAAKNKFSLFTP
ncbi:MAG: amino acid adenylation domain-containing protein, partial [Candidatus Aminicenantes bacterium]